MRQLSEQIAMLVEESAARRRKRHQSGGHPQVAAQPLPGPGAPIPGSETFPETCPVLYMHWIGIRKPVSNLGFSLD